MESYEVYTEERAEALACGVRDFPTYNEWMQNLTTPNAERIRAEERIEMRESFGDWGDQDYPDSDYY